MVKAMKFFNVLKQKLKALISKSTTNNSFRNLSNYTANSNAPSAKDGEPQGDNTVEILKVTFDFAISVLLIVLLFLT